MKKYIVISGPSGVGKDAVIGELLLEHPEIKKVVTTTTRTARAGEEEGKAYHFVSEDEFKKMEEAGEFVETNPHFKARYGVTKKALKEVELEGKIPLANVEPNGAENIAKSVGKENVLSFFILPTDEEELKKRFISREGELDESRFQESLEQMKHAPEYNYQVINKEGELDKTVREIADIIHQEIEFPEKEHLYNK